VTPTPAAAWRLMVIVPDVLSDLVRKGEITDRYYNPGELFGDVHIVLTNDDRPDPGVLQRTVGGARLHLHNFPAGKGLFVRTLGWRPWLLRGWARPVLDLARRVRPQLIRCHGASVNAFAAYRIKQALGIPYLVSLHINPDVDVRSRARYLHHRLAFTAQQTLERLTLCAADLVMPVYQPIVPYLRRLGVPRFEVCYNALNPVHLLPKDDYGLHDPVRVVSVGRQFREKNPENLIRAVAGLPGVELALVGDGPYHEHLRQVARHAGVENRVRFERAVPNDQLCRSLRDYDIFAVHTEYWELSKSVLEPLLVGLPLVINRRIGEPVPELSPDTCELVENTAAAYEAALRRLISDHAYRERLGRVAYNHARQRWAPDHTEAKFVEIYRRYLLKP
jgi:glycosyltransferase involved in cell wall biosynthesis